MHSWYLLPRICALPRGVSSLGSVLEERDHSASGTFWGAVLLRRWSLFEVPLCICSRSFG